MGTGGSSSPCASCKLLRRRCAKECMFAPYFPPDDPQRFAIVHKVFGASNVSKMLQELPVQQRGDAVSSLVYEANARVRDPVYGCVGAISYLQTQVSHLQMQLAVAQAQILSIQMQHETTTDDDIMAASLQQQQQQLLLGVEDYFDNNNSLLMPTPHHNNWWSNNHPMQLQQYVNLAVSAAAAHVIQDPLLKRESLWT